VTAAASPLHHQAGPHRTTCGWYVDRSEAPGLRWTAAPARVTCERCRYLLDAAAQACAVADCDQPAAGVWDVVARPTSYLAVPLCTAHEAEHRADEHVTDLRPSADRKA